MLAETPRREVVRANMGGRSADIALLGGTLVNVETLELFEADVAIVGDRIAAVGDVTHLLSDETDVIDVAGKYLTPGFIDGHLHSYHSYLNLTEFARFLLEHGTTAYADGFYGQAVVSGVDAIDLCIEELARTPLTLLFLAPAIAHRQVSNYGVPPAGDGLSTAEMMMLLERDNCFGLEEPSHELITAPEAFHFANDAYYDLCERAIELGKVVTGHAVRITDEELTAFVAAGVSTDHEATSKAEAIARLRYGMTLLSRFGSGALLQDTPELVKAITEDGLDPLKFGFCSDLQALDDFDSGVVNRNVQVAIDHGVDPLVAVRGATLTTARGLRVEQELGSLVPGKLADVLVLPDLEDMLTIEMVISSGEIVRSNDEWCAEFRRPDYPRWACSTVDVGPIELADVQVSARGRDGSVRVRTIDITDGSIVTEMGEAELALADDIIQPDRTNDVLKAIMINRHEGPDRVAHAFVRGFGLQGGAVGMTVNAETQNLVVLGTNDRDIVHVSERLDGLDGGIVSARDGASLAEFPLPLFGLQSVSDMVTAREQFDRVVESMRTLGCDLEAPLVNLEFLCAVGQIPRLRLSEYGLVDIERGELVELICA